MSRFVFKDFVEVIDNVVFEHGRTSDALKSHETGYSVHRAISEELAHIRLQCHHMYQKLGRCPTLARLKETESYTIRPHSEVLRSRDIMSYALSALETGYRLDLTTVHACRRH